MQIGKTYILPLMLCFVSAFAASQNNPLKINDKIYAYYEKCRQFNRDPISLKMADTLFTRATTLHDVKAQCIAYFIRGSYYSNANDINHMRIEKDKLFRFSRKTPYTQYFFGIWSHIINYYANNGDYDTALKELKGFQKTALELKNEYGIGNSYIKSGDIYGLIGNDEASIAEYLKALNYYNSIHKTGDLPPLYFKLGSKYHRIDKEDLAEKYLLKAYESCQIEDANGSYLMNIIKMYVETDKLDKAKEYMAKLAEWEKKFKLSEQLKTNKAIILITYNTKLGNFDEALKLTESSRLSDELENYYLYSVYNKMGDYTKALYHYVKYINISDNRKKKIQTEQLAQYAALYENERLKIEKNELALKNATISISELQTKQKLMLADKDKNKLQLQNTHLALNNKDLLIKSQRAEVQRQKEKTARLAEEIEDNRKTGLLLTVILVLLLLSFITYAIIHIRASRRIRQEMAKEAKARKDAEEAREEAIKADNLKSLFLQNISHEIRTPLNAIVGFSDIVTSPDTEITTEEKNEFVNLIHSNSKMLTTLINDILDLSKLESGSYKAHIETKNASEICRKALASIKGYQTAEVELRLDLPQEDIIFRTDEERLTQVLHNLLSNACKYTEHGSITLSCMEKGNNVEFAVTDTGCGISPDNAERIFRRFEKLDSFKQGTGLGLNICLQIAELLHGSIRLDTGYTTGARFVFALPL